VLLGLPLGAPGTPKWILPCQNKGVRPTQYSVYYSAPNLRAGASRSCLSLSTLYMQYERSGPKIRCGAGLLVGRFLGFSDCAFPLTPPPTVSSYHEAQMQANPNLGLFHS
jgi:hypothetical protein